MKSNGLVGVMCGLVFSMTGGAACAQDGPLSCSDAEQKTYYSQLFNDDQKLRGTIRAEIEAAPNRSDELIQRLEHQDAANQRRLDAIVDACGWPDAKTFLNSNLEVAFYVIQHSPLAYTERYKDRIEKDFAAGKIPEPQMEDFRRYLARKRKLN